MAALQKISIHALREEGDCRARGSRDPTLNFNPRPPRGGRLWQLRFILSWITHFNPRPPRGGRLASDALQQLDQNFNPRPPRGGRRTRRNEPKRGNAFQSTPSARRATHPTCSRWQTKWISIHALREEGDLSIAQYTKNCELFQSTPSARRATCPFCQRLECLKISIHALREEGDSAATSPANPRKKFQSTPSARRATASCDFQVRHLVISIHALREEGDADNKAVLLERFCISIHALREEGDSYAGTPYHLFGRFQSTPSARRATASFATGSAINLISIHALREEGDTGDAAGFPAVFYFNPRPPRGGRPRSPSFIVVSKLFQSTPSARRATDALKTAMGTPTDFNPRPPRGGRRHGSCGHSTSRVISIHALREEGDHAIVYDLPIKQDISIHALREEGDDAHF